MKSFKPWNQDDFGIRLRMALYARKVNQSELAEALGVVPSTITRWQKSDINLPGLNHLAAIAQFLKVEQCWLISGCEEHVPRDVKELEDSKKSQRSMRRIYSERVPSRRFK